MKSRYSRYFHVVTELEIGREEQCLGHRYISPRLEHHHGYWASRKRIANDELSDNIQTYLLIRYGLDHTDREDVEERHTLRKTRLHETRV